ncbi:hypothetical protein NDU88_008315 [Pleurodeles waltl]|uniref:Uncharacterized protein n=1 Tax=Pleurodeles waltl TaxID=8319 RepID=A0AAV7VTA1_PLEWA|nr:hypothetical protein NDU88_008315 [Pleurodeles waltl]
MELWLNQPLARLSKCDRESPRVQDANKRRNLDPTLQFTRGTNEMTTAVCFRERADVREKKERKEEDNERGAGVRRVEEKWVEEEKKQCNGDEEKEIPQAATRRGTRPPHSTAERHRRREGACHVPGVR